MQQPWELEEDGRRTSLEWRRQPEAEEGGTLMEMPGFRKISSGQEMPPLVMGCFRELGEGGETDGEFEFGSAFRDSLNGLEPVDAEELFFDGCIRPVYPFFRGAIVLEKKGGEPKISGVEFQDGDDDSDTAGAIGLAEDSIDFCLSFRDFMTCDEGSVSTFSSSSCELWESPDQESALPAESYSVWSPVQEPQSPDTGKKSQTTDGFLGTPKKWRLLNLVPRRRSSDGKERFFLVAASVTSAAEAAKHKDKRKGKSLIPAENTTPAAGDEKKEREMKGGAKLPKETEMAAAHRLYYAKGEAATADRRRSFLPYRKDLFGFHAHAGVRPSSSSKFNPRGQNKQQKQCVLLTTRDKGLIRRGSWRK